MGVSENISELEERLLREDIAYFQPGEQHDVQEILLDHKRRIGHRVHTLVVRGEGLGPSELSQILRSVNAYARSEAESPAPPQTYVTYPGFFPVTDDLRGYVHLFADLESLSDSLLSSPWHPQTSILLISDNPFLSDVLEQTAQELGHLMDVRPTIEDEDVQDADLVIMDGDSISPEDSLQLARHNKPLIYAVSGSIKEEAARTLPTLGANVVDKRHLVAALESHSGRAPLAERYRNNRILVLDDEERQVEGLVKILDHYGYRDVQGYTDPRAALSLLKKEQKAIGNGIDMLITDFRLPGMDGLEVAQRSRELGVGNIIMYSGYQPEGAFLNAYRAGIINDAIPKVRSSVTHIPRYITRTFAKNEEKRRIKQLVKQGYELLIMIKGEAGSGKSTFADALVKQYGFHRPIKDRVGLPRPGEEYPDSVSITRDEYEKNRAAGLYDITWEKENVGTGERNQYGYMHIPRGQGPVVIATRSDDVEEQVRSLGMPLRRYRLLGLNAERQMESLRRREGVETINPESAPLDMRETLTYSFPHSYSEAIQEVERNARIVLSDMWRHVQRWRSSP